MRKRFDTVAFILNFKTKIFLEHCTQSTNTNTANFPPIHKRNNKTQLKTLVKHFLLILLKLLPSKPFGGKNGERARTHAHIRSRIYVLHSNVNYQFSNNQFYNMFFYAFVVVAVVALI